MRARRSWAARAVVAAVLLLGASACVDSDEPELADASATTDEAAPSDSAAPDDGTSGCESGPEVEADDAPEVEVPDGPEPTELVVEDLEVGEGREVVAGDEVSLQYTGVLFATGEEFDTSWDDLSPLTFPTGQGAVIPGFDEGVIGMQPGGRRQITIPPELGYGDEGAGGVIPPDATLVFVVDLVEVCPPGAAPEDPSASTPATPAGVELPPGPDGRTLEGATPCPAADGSEERVAVFAEPPPTCIEEGEALAAEIAVSVTDDAGDVQPFGTIVVALDTEGAPVTTNNFVVLSRYGFYDGVPFHRLMPDFVAQVGGSGEPGPDGTPDYGTTGPGYDGADVEYPTDGYAVGDVAMARSAAAVSGSQIFLVTSEDGVAALDSAGNYPRFGRITEGLELAVQMADDGDAATNGTPLVLYTIDSVTIRPA